MEKKILGMGGTGHFQPCPCEAGGRNHEDRVAGPDRVCSNPASSVVCLLISAAEGHRSLTQRGSLDSGEDCPSSPPSSALLTGRALGNFSTLSLKASVCPSAKWLSQGQLGNRVSVRAEHVVKCKNVSRIRLRPQHFPSVPSLRHLRQSESGLPHFGVPGPLIWISEFRSKTVLVAAHPPCHLLPCLLPTVREPGCRLVLGNHPYLQKSLSLSHTSATCTLISSSQSCYLSTCSVN